MEDELLPSRFARTTTDCTTAAFSGPSFAASSAVNKYAPSETERLTSCTKYSRVSSAAAASRAAGEATARVTARHPPKSESASWRLSQPPTRHTRASGGEPGSDQTAATTPRLTSVKVQLPPGLSRTHPASSRSAFARASPSGAPGVYAPPIQSPSPSAAGGVSRVTSPVGTSTRTMASPAPHVVCSTSASFPSQGSAARGADAYRPGNAPRAVAGPRASAASSTKSATPRTSRDGFPSAVQSMTRSAHVAACAPVATARACETYARVAPSGEKRGHSAEETSAVSGSASFAFRFESVSASAGGDREGASKRNKPLGRLKQNTRPRRRDVLLKLHMSPSHAAQTSWSDSAPGAEAGAHAGPEAATAPRGSPSTFPTADDSVSSTYTVGSIFPTSCSPQSSRHSPRPRQGRRFGVFVSSSFFCFDERSPADASSFAKKSRASFVTPIPHSGSICAAGSGASATYATRVSSALQLTPPNVPSAHNAPCVLGDTIVSETSAPPSQTSSAIPAPRSPPASLASRATSRLRPLGDTLDRHTPRSSIPKLGWRKVSKASFAFALAFESLVSDAGRGTAATDRRVSSEARFLCAVCTCRVIPSPSGSGASVAPATKGIAVKDSNRDVSRATAAAAASASASGDARAAVASIGRAMKRRGGRRAREGALSRTEPPPRTPRVAWPDAAGARPPGVAFAPREVGDASVREACVLAGARLGSIPQVRTCVCDAECFEGGFRFRRRAFRDKRQFRRKRFAGQFGRRDPCFWVHNPQPNPIIPLVENVFRDRRLAEPRFSLGVTFSARIDTPTASRIFVTFEYTHTHKLQHVWTW